MRKLIRFFCVVVAVSYLSGCRLVAPSLMFNKSLEKWHIAEYSNDTTGRRVIYLGMVHIGKPQYYEEIKNYLDSLRGEGYVFLYEGVGIPDSMGLDSAQVDLLRRKMRKMIGVHLSNYTNEENKSLPKGYNKKKYDDQDYSYLGVFADSSYCIHADLLTPELIRRYEESKGEIRLTDYDWEIPLLAKYKPRKSRPKTTYGQRDYFLTVLRDKKVIETVAESEHDRMVIILGAVTTASEGFWAIVWGIRQTINALSRPKSRRKPKPRKRLEKRNGRGRAVAEAL